MRFDNTEESLQRARAEAALPPAPPPKPERSAWGAIGRGIVGGAAQLLGQAEGAFTIKGMERRRPDDDPIQQERDRSEKRRADIAQQALDYERSLRPDAQTATTAENVVYGISRSLTKAIGASVVAGPAAGAGVFGASESAGTYDDLRRDGVDPTTAGRAAAVAGVAGAAGVALPLMGSTLARTAALYVAGGPGAFMAQQAATREILQRANYGELAKRYDPLDLVGLSLSALMPLPFAGMGAARNIKAARKQAAGLPDQAPRADQAPGDTEAAPTAARAPEPDMTPEAVDAAMVHNLTLTRQALDAQAVAVAEEAGRRLPALSDFAATFKGEKIEPPANVEPAFFAWLNGKGGIALDEKFDITGDTSGVKANPGGVFKRGGQPTDTLATAAIEDGYLRPGAGARELVELIQQAMRGEKVLDFEQQQQQQRAAQRSEWESNMAEHVATLERRLQLLGVDPEQAKGSAQAMEAYLRQYEDALVAARVAEAADDARTAQLLEPPKVDASPQVDEARQTFADLQDSGKPIEQFIADRPDMAPDVKNLIIGMYEAGADGARADRLLADFARTMAAQRLRPAQDVAADVVEAARGGKTVTPEPAPAAASQAMTPDTAAGQMTADRITTLEAESPDMVVRIENDGRQVTLREELQRIRQEAAEGTDAELGALDADLVRVAAECALSTGAA